MPHKTFTAGSVLTASDVNTYLMEQAAMTFTNAAARNTALSTPVEGMVAFLEDVDKFTWYDGSGWHFLNPWAGSTTEYYLGLSEAEFTPAYFLDIRVDQTAAPISDAGNSADARLHFPYSTADSLITIDANHAALLIHNADTAGDSAVILRQGAVDFGLVNDDTDNSLRVYKDTTLVAAFEPDGAQPAFTVNSGDLSVTAGQITSRDVLPNTDNLYDLGSSSERWDDVWATNSTIQTSDLRTKDEVAPLDRGLKFIDKLKPIEFTRKDDKHDGQRYWGFAYQDLKKTLRSSAYGVTAEPAKRGEPGGVRPAELIAPLVQAVQELSARVDQLERQLGQTT